MPALYSEPKYIIVALSLGLAEADALVFGWSKLCTGQYTTQTGILVDYVQDKPGSFDDIEIGTRVYFGTRWNERNDYERIRQLVTSGKIVPQYFTREPLQSTGPVGTQEPKGIENDDVREITFRGSHRKGEVLFRVTINYLGQDVHKDFVIGESQLSSYNGGMAELICLHADRAEVFMRRELKRSP